MMARLYLLVVLAAPLAAMAQTSSPIAAPIASVATDGVTLAAPLAVANGRATIGNNGTVTAGDKTAEVTLARGGVLRLCATTALHMAMDRSVEKAGDAAGTTAGLMLSLDRGAFEATYTPGQYSDVILTPDLRILVSGPGHADLKLRVSRQGDTCIDNRADAAGDAPYITVTSMMEGGIYRVRAGQRVLFEHGSLQQVVDNEQEPCGCPAAVPTAVADNTFPVAVSEGLAPAAAPPVTPIVPAGQPHAQVTASLGYEAGQPLPPPPPPVAAPPAPAAAPAAPPRPKRGVFGRIGHFFGRLFGGS
jgi:hypothetical protein